MNNADDELATLLYDAIKDKARTGHHFSKSGQRETYNRLEDLPKQLRDLSRKKLRDLINDLLERGVIQNQKGKGLAPTGGDDM